MAGVGESAVERTRSDGSGRIWRRIFGRRRTGEVSGPSTRADAPPAGARRLRRPFRAGLVCGLLLAVAVPYTINHTSFADRLIVPLWRDDTRGQADAIVVLGAGIVGRCEPNLNALRRVMLAVQRWREHRAPELVFTGGRPRGLTCAVAEVMARFAVDLGVPATAIRVETDSHSTHENAVLSAPLLRAMRAQRVLIVTDRLHMPRAEAVFAREGFAIERASVPVYAGHVDNTEMLIQAMREAVALAYYRVRGWTATPRVGPSRAPMSNGQGAAAGAAAAEAEARVGETRMTVKNPQGPIVILGASYAGGWAPVVPGLTFVNKGVAGEQSWEMLARFDRDVLPSNPRAVMIWGFINDIHRSPRDQVDRAVAKARQSLQEMIARARQHEIEPVVATELTIRPLDTWSETLGSWVGWAMGKQSYQEWINSRVIDTNAWLRTLASREGLLLLDLHPVLSDASGMRRKQFAKGDGSHIPPEGYQALSAYATPLLERHFRSSSQRP